MLLSEISISIVSLNASVVENKFDSKVSKFQFLLSLLRAHSCPISLPPFVVATTQRPTLLGE